jgi:hypothetical protein
LGISFSSVISSLPHPLSCLSHLSFRMVNTRSHNANAENNNTANPPPPPTLEQVLVMQAQMLQTMQ